jgi:hypothetical protein
VEEARGGTVQGGHIYYYGDPLDGGFFDVGLRFRGGGTDTSWAVGGSQWGHIEHLTVHYDPDTGGTVPANYVRCVREKPLASARPPSVRVALRVGEQVWTAENLDVGRYNDGTAIKEAQSDEEWVTACAAGEGAWCYYPDNLQNARKAGKLYNQYALARVCPRGWRIPTEEDWTKLCAHLGGDARKLIGEPFKAVAPAGWRQIVREETLSGG